MFSMENSGDLEDRLNIQGFVSAGQKGWPVWPPGRKAFLPGLPEDGCALWLVGGLLRTGHVQELTG